MGELAVGRDRRDVSALIRRTWTAMLAAMAMLTTTLVVAVVSASPAAAADIPLTVSITGLTELDSPEEGVGEGFCWGDYTYEVTINGVTRTKPEFSIDPGFGTGCIISHPTVFPTDLSSFDATVDVPDTLDRVLVTIKIVDVDTFNDDTMDVSPDPSARILRLAVDPLTGAHTVVRPTGEPFTVDGVPTVNPGSYEGTQDDSVRIGLEVSSSVTDSDGDGIPDGMETAGFDWDGSGIVGDVLGEVTDPLRADMFLELDVAASPTTGALPWSRDQIAAVKAAFARAPIANPDGSFGVTLWVDTGALVDPNASEFGGAGTCANGVDDDGNGLVDGADVDCAFLEGSAEAARYDCGDFLDNDGDGLSDANDPDCLVGDNLGGGGSVVPQLSICNLDTNFYAAKATLFNANRARWFRYAISVPSSDPDPSVDSDGDGIATNDPCGSGGQAEIGGNDFVDHNGDGGTFMHEFGHALALRHGGFENLNCKPNHVSVMNYQNQFGILRVGGGQIYDFSPAGIDLSASNSRNNEPSITLSESSLDETSPVDPSDSANLFRYTDGNLATVDLDSDGTADDLIPPPGADQFGLLRSNPLDQAVDWDGSGAAGDTTSAAVNISQAGRLVTGGATTAVGPRACRTSSGGETLEGADEWSVIQIPFRQNGDSATGAILPHDDTTPTRVELELVDEATRSADLSVSTSDDPDPVVAGTEGTVTGTVVNNGPNPANGVATVIELPTGFTPLTAPGCTIDGQEVVCANEIVLAGESAEHTVTYLAAADLAYPLPTTVETTVRATHRGPDPVPGNDEATESTSVIAVADLSVDDAFVTGPELLVVAEPAAFESGVTAANAGPSSPMDASVDVTGSHPFATPVPVTPLSAVALAIGEPQPLTSEIIVTCDDAGTGDLDVGFTISPTSPFDTDPAPGNNTADAATEVECLLPVAINIRPGQTHNSMNAGSGNVEVGVLTTAAGEYGLPLPFDTAWIDLDSVVFASEVAALDGLGSALRRSQTRDVKELSDEKTRDGDSDLRGFFTASETGLLLGDIEACVVGTFERPDGTGGRFIGCDSVNVLP